MTTGFQRLATCGLLAVVALTSSGCAAGFVHQAQSRVASLLHFSDAEEPPEPSSNGAGQGTESSFGSLLSQAELGSAKAQARLASFYFYGTGVERDKTKAIAWYQVAAENNNAEAQFQLGKLYQTGEVMSQDFVKARRWFVSAAKQNHPRAMVHLGELFRYGEGVDLNLQQARWWYGRAANLGDSLGRRELNSLEKSAGAQVHSAG